MALCLLDEPLRRALAGFCVQAVRLQRLRDSATTDAAPLHSGSGGHRGDVLLGVSHVHRLPAPPVQGELSHNIGV